MSNEKRTKKIVIVGSGPAGCLLAWRLLHRKTTTTTYDITLLERRPDPRIAASKGQEARTFPLALQSRGWDSMPTEIHNLLTHRGAWTVGSCFHNAGKVRTMLRDKPTFTVDRNQLALALIEAVAEAVKTAAMGHSFSMQFETSFTGRLDLEKRTIETESSNVEDEAKKGIISFDYLIAADGGRSRIRCALADQGKIEFEQEEIPHDYRPIHFSREAPAEPVVKPKEPTRTTLLDYIWSSFFPGAPKSTALPPIRLESDKIHAWMLPKSVRILACPIHPGTVTGAIVFEKGQDPFKDMTSAKQVHEYFQRMAPKDLGRLMTESQAAELFTRPTSTLVSVKCDRLHADPCVLLLGDAAHAVSAAAGQGANSALQDVQVFMQILDNVSDDWDQALPAFTTERLPDAHAVREVSDYSAPRTSAMRTEMIARAMLRKMLPKWLGNWLLRPLPMECLIETNWSYTKVQEATQWWIDRVKATSKNK